MSDSISAATNGGGDVKATIKTEGDCGKAQKITNQIEYYFGDINLPRDKFLQEEMKKDHGWVPLTTMLKFNRLAAITTDIDAIAAAIRDSHLIDLSEDDQKIRRNPEEPLPENTLEYWQEIKRRTAYLKGFPQDTTLDEIAEFVGKYGTVQNIVMRKTRGGKETPKVFKGSVFATFATVDQAKNVAGLKEMKFKEEYELVHMMQDEYWSSKHAERQQQKEIKKQMKKTQIEQQNKAHYKKGMVLKLCGLEPTEGTAAAVANEEEGKEKKKSKGELEQVNALKAFFEPFSKPAFVLIDGNQASIRFFADDENAASDALEKAQKVSNADGQLLINDMKLAGSVLEGEEEAKYWAEFTKAKTTKAKREKEWKQKGGAKGKKMDRKELNSRKRRADRGLPTGAKDQPKAKRTVFKDDEDAEEGADSEMKNGNAEGGEAKSTTVDNDEESHPSKKAKVEDQEEGQA